MEVKIEKGMLIIKIPVTEPTLSATGKTLSVASSHGNKETTAMVQGKPVIVGVNAYIKAK